MAEKEEAYRENTAFIDREYSGLVEVKAGIDGVKNGVMETFTYLLEKIIRHCRYFQSNPSSLFAIIYPAIQTEYECLEKQIARLKQCKDSLYTLFQQFTSTRTALENYQQFANPRNRPTIPNPCTYTASTKEDTLLIIESVEYLHRQQESILLHNQSIRDRLDGSVRMYTGEGRDREDIGDRQRVGERMGILWREGLGMHRQLTRLMELIENDANQQKRNNKAKCDHLVENISIISRQTLSDANILWKNENSIRYANVTKIPLLLEVLTGHQYLGEFMQLRNDILASMERLPLFTGPRTYYNYLGLGANSVDDLKDVDLEKLLQDDDRENTIEFIGNSLRRYNLCRWDFTQSAEVLASLEGKVLDFVRRLNRFLNTNRVAYSPRKDLIRFRCASTLMRCLGMTCLHLLKKSEVLEESVFITGVESSLWGSDCGETFRLFSRDGERIFSREIVWGDMMIAAECTVRGWDMYRVDEPNIRYMYRLDA